MPKLNLQLISDIQKNRTGETLSIEGSPDFGGVDPGLFWLSLQGAFKNNTTITTIELSQVDIESTRKLVRALHYSKNDTAQLAIKEIVEKDKKPLLTYFFNCFTLNFEITYSDTIPDGLKHAINYLNNNFLNPGADTESESESEDFYKSRNFTP